VLLHASADTLNVSSLSPLPSDGPVCILHEIGEG